MVAPSAQLPPWPLTPETALNTLAPAATLKQTVCYLPPGAIGEGTGPLAKPPWAVATAIQRLLTLVMELRSPAGGWPADVPQTPIHLAPYVSDETWELLETLKPQATQGYRSQAETSPPKLCALADVMPHLLWLVASSSYETMHLIEGVRTRVYAADAQFALRIVRLVPVLELVTETTTATVDLVTHHCPEPHLYLPELTTLRLLDHDLDNGPLSGGQLLGHLKAVAAQAQPGLAELLATGLTIQMLGPGQRWQPGILRLHLHLADMGPRETQALLSAMAALLPVTAPPVVPTPGPTAFTLDDFADTLSIGRSSPAGILGNWLTFTDEAWVQHFLVTVGQRLINQHLPTLGRLAATNDPGQELACVDLVHGVSTVLLGPNGLFKHTFVHEPALVADVWPRLRWYLAQTSERIMQWMGGLSVQVLSPGKPWRQGTLSLRSLMHLTTQHHRWTLDLSSGQPLTAPPDALPEQAVIRQQEQGNDPSPITVAELITLVQQDLESFNPAIAALGQGTPIYLHCLETDEGRQSGTLSLGWCFTLAGDQAML
jgi:hypothetical protein